MVSGLIRPIPTIQYRPGSTRSGLIPGIPLSVDCFAQANDGHHRQISPRPNGGFFFATKERPSCELVKTQPGDWSMTPRERKDMPWLITAFAVVIVVAVGGALFYWY